MSKMWERYYKLHEGESLNDFAQCSCGGSLIYTEIIDESAA
ncbi:hypothetical protein [Methanobacterium petrolearium]|nr:hypothetical protein [Methanobacterium petrolearium]MBP1946421.1 hypothetical protein [Methanobacterium petrolearium]